LYKKEAPGKAGSLGALPEWCGILGTRAMKDVICAALGLVAACIIVLLFILWRVLAVQVIAPELFPQG